MSDYRGIRGVRLERFQCMHAGFRDHMYLYHTHGCTRYILSTPNCACREMFDCLEVIPFLSVGSCLYA